MRKGFLSSDGFVGFVFALLFFGVAWSTGWLRGIETATYDLGVRMAAAQPDPRIAVIEIDDASIERMGRWPWPRDLHAEMISRLHQAGAKVVALGVFLFEPQQDAGATYLKDLARFYDGSTLGTAAPLPAPSPASVAAAPSTAAAPATIAAAAAPVAAQPAAAPAPAAMDIPAPLRTDLIELRNRLEQAQHATDMDAVLAGKLREAGNVVLPIYLQPGVRLGKPDKAPAEFVLRNALFNVQDGPDGAEPPLSAASLSAPIAVLGDAAAGLGNLSAIPDTDGAIRFEALVLQIDDTLYPSMSLAIAARALNLTPEDIAVTLGVGVTLGGIEIRTTPQLEMYNSFYPVSEDEPAFRTDSFYDVFTGNVRLEDYKDKIVIIGASAAGVGDRLATPVSASMAPVQALAHTVSSILQGHFFTRPAWATGVELGVALLLVAWLCLGMPRLSPTLAATVTLALVAALLAAELALLRGQRQWLMLMTPLAFLLSGHLLLTVKRSNLTEKLKLKTEAEGAESNKMLGLAYQGQGQLDLAFEKFRRLPKDASTLDLLYNLALDFERKRQHNKALTVYQDINATDPAFRDTATRMKRAKQLEEAVLIGGGGTMAGTMILDSGDVQRPMLGRYEVEKELGKGAMGVVYLGKDPKINRVVAIKTLALGQEFEADELAEAKARFFREAETAGRLNHPNIVTIYDAGEEHDLCYIAMELLKGKDLVANSKPASLLPVDKVFRIIADAADALDYAHQQGVVHRDIKPANLMYDDQTGVVKLTDFGIARITDSSKTKTGMVLGTPSYMSPEQLSGKKVEGRSDLFSLGVTFYQLLTGQQPFQGDSMAALMFKIANDKHPPIGVLRPDLPPAIEAIFDKVLAKDADSRYQRGAEFASDVRRCAAELPKA